MLYCMGDRLKYLTFIIVSHVENIYHIWNLKELKQTEKVF